MIKELKIWYFSDVRDLCITEGLYTRGTNTEYIHLANYISNNKPTKNTIYHVACDILSHSNSEDTITSLMSKLAKLVKYVYEIEE